MPKKILITSGPTRAPLDAVRYLTNRSTGRFGTLLAREALRCGARVTMVYGRGSETPKPHPRLRLIPVETNMDLGRTLRRELRRREYDVVIHAMAVLDFQPIRVRKGKVASKGGEWVVRLVPTQKIVRQLRRWAPQAFLIGFKLEDQSLSRTQLVSRGRRLLRESRADLVVANQLSAGDDHEHVGYLLDSKGVIEKRLGKQALAKAILARCKALGLLIVQRLNIRGFRHGTVPLE